MGCPPRVNLEDFAAARLSSSDARAFEAHQATCARCGPRVARVRSIRALLSSYEPPEPTELDWARMDRKVLSALAVPPAAPRHRLRDLLPPLALGALASSALTFGLLRAPRPAVPADSPPAYANALAVALGPDSLARAPGGGPALLESEPQVRPGSHLFSGAGSISLQTAAATGIHLGPESHGVLEKLAPGHTELRLVEGLLLAEVKPLAPGQRFEVTVGDLRIQVRGTAFAVERSSGVTSVSVVHGLVEVQRDGGAARLLGGPSSLTVRDGAPLAEPGSLDGDLAARFPLSFTDAPVESVIEKGKLARLHSIPEGAEVWVGGAFRGTTPLLVLLPPGRQSVRLRSLGRPELDLDLDAGVQPVELATLPPLDADKTLFQKGAGHREQTPGPSAARASPVAPLDSAQSEVRNAMQLQVRSHMDELVRCYERAMKRNPSLAGALTLDISLDGAGVVRGVRAREPVDPRFLDCAAESIRGWSLPGTGHDESVQIPLQLSRKN